jgi:hypothetical protein
MALVQMCHLILFSPEYFVTGNEVSGEKIYFTEILILILGVKLQLSYIFIYKKYKQTTSIANAFNIHSSCIVFVVPTVRKETASPSKKKKTKSNDAANAETVPTEETKILDDDDNEKTPEKKPSNKEEEDEVKM